MIDAVGKERLVLDLSCRKKDGKYHCHRPVAEVYGASVNEKRF
ncbi:MAG: hypothetical protein V8S96_07770 [Lachnospiraceae bacterium]